MNGQRASIVTLPGDGVGPEVMAEAVKVLYAAADRFGFAVAFDERKIGGAAIDAYDVPLRPEDIERGRKADAVLLGAVGGPKWDNPASKVRPEQGLLTIRKELGLYANLRPVAVMDSLADRSPVKAELLRGVDIVVVRELTGGLYFGRPRRRWLERRGRAAVDTLIYREYEIARVVRLAFELARGRRGKVTSVDKANVIETSRLWRTIVTEIAAEYPDVACEHQLVDSMAMNLIRVPAQYDVIVTENMFGDILTDEASLLAGSIGVLPSASLGAPRAGSPHRLGLFEPIHGSAPDIAGQGKANPTGMILSAAMMLRLSLGLAEPAAAIESAVRQAIDAGQRTPDVTKPGQVSMTTSQFGDEVVDRLQRT